jgi:hypothetical protein
MKKWCKISLIPLLSLLMLVFSCREKPDPPTYYIPDAYKSYIAFQLGSYWVYEDSVSGALDSVVVDQYKHDFSPYYEDLDAPDEVLYYNEYFSVVTFSFFTSKKHTLNSFNVCDHPTEGSSCYMTTRALNTTSETAYIHIAQYNFKLGRVNSGDDETVAIYPSYMMDSSIYETVVKTYIPTDYTEEGYHSYYYFAKNAGIIRKEIQTSWGTWRIWKLKRYHAVR